MNNHSGRGRFPLHVLLCGYTSCHRHTRAADGVRLVKLRHRASEGLSQASRSRLLVCIRVSIQPRGWLHRLQVREVRRNFGQARAHSTDARVRQNILLAEFLRKRAKDHPVGTRLARWHNRRVGHLGAALRVDKDCAFFGVRRRREDHIRQLGAFVAIGPNIHHKRVFRDLGLIEVVRVEKEHHLRGRLGRGLRRQEAEVQSRHAPGSIVKHIVPVPSILHHAALLRDRMQLLEQRVTIRAGQHSSTHDQHGLRRALERLAEGMGPGGKLG
mmetsp:Transcript_14486/g.24549  ORF Transcript_14486/g.24549 Transcript_14486/m.24549 type:complete len:271 (+) Transcript_14486:647-1459(+)